MGVVVAFPAAKFPDHERASDRAGALAAKRAITSAVKPADLAVGASKIGCHHSAGMRSRWDHLRAAWTLAPISDAIASGEDQSAMTSLNVQKAGDEVVGAQFMESSLGQFVLTGKARVSHDCEFPPGQTVQMAKIQSSTDYLDAFLARVTAAREAQGYKQREIAALLGVEQDKYAKYETRSFLPHDLVEKFCLATKVTTDWLFTGRGQGPAVTAVAKKPKRMRRPVKKAKAA